MSFCASACSWRSQFRVVLDSFLQRPGLPFSDILPEQQIQAAFDEEGATFAQDEDAIYTPAVTLWAFLSQVLFKGEQRSCIAAVARVSVLLVALGKEPPSGNTGAYCRARAKLPLAIIRRLTCELAGRCERALPNQWLWHGRHVYLADGFTISMPDTDANQAEYPQHNVQPAGLGFPIARCVVLLSLATAMAGDLAIGPYSGKETGETALLRELLSRFHAGDILLADQYYCSYFMICLLLAAGVDFVTRLHHLRKSDFRRGQRLAAGDHVVQWFRPAKPTWMDEATYEQMPQSITIREVEFHVAEPGFRVERLVVVTTLLDARQYTRDDLAELYHRRWLAELDIRTIKVTLGMDVLRCKSPEMVHREVWSCLLAYNLIRQSMLNTASQRSLSPRQLSFTAAMQQIAAGWIVVLLGDELSGARMQAVHREQTAEHRVGDRPHRVEPRAIKRRPKPHKLLTKPRKEARAELLAAARLS